MIKRYFHAGLAFALGCALLLPAGIAPAAAPPCARDDFKSFLAAYSRLSKKEQLAYVAFPLKYSEYVFGSDEKPRVSRVGAEHFKNHKKVVLSPEEMKESPDWVYVINKTDRGYELGLGMVDSEILTSLYFQWDGQCWRLVEVETYD